MEEWNSPKDKAAYRAYVADKAPTELWDERKGSPRVVFDGDDGNAMGKPS